jgi:multidrug resistance protein MdtO
MAAGASTLTSLPGSWEWLRNFLREELAPYPGRVARVARMVIAATIVMVITMTFQIPFGAYGAIYALTLSRESPEATLKDAKVTIVSFAYAVLYILVAAVCVAADPGLRLAWVLGSFFLIFFAMRALDYHAAARFGYLMAIVIPRWDLEISAEQKVDDTLWAIFTLSFASILTALIELMYARFFPLDNLAGELVERLTQVASLLRSLAKGIDDPEARRKVARLAALGTSRMRRDLIRSHRSPGSADKMGAVVALVGQLVDLGANATLLSEPRPQKECPDIEQLADRVEAVANHLLHGSPIPPIGSVEELDLCDDRPLILEIDRAVRLIFEVLSGAERPGAYRPAPEQPPANKRLLAADAFSNPEYLQFAIRGGVAASASYLIYNLIAWPGISTAVTTCILTALSTVGSSRQKQILRFGGAVAGGVILGFGSQMFILPMLESIAGFTVLFLIVTTLAAWVATSSPRLSYFGVQTAVAFYLINLEEFKFQTSLAVARDRVAGIFLGLLAMWCIFDQLWSASAALEMKRTFISALRLLAKLMRAPIAMEPNAAIEETHALRETIEANFEKLRQQADGVLLEFGRARESNLALRAYLLQWQLPLRILFIVRIALLKYRLRLPGFELPEATFRMQEQEDAHNAQRLENLADLVSGKLASSTLVPKAPEALSTFNVRDISNPGSYPSLRSFLALCPRVDSLLASLEDEITSSSR